MRGLSDLPQSEGPRAPRLTSCWSFVRLALAVTTFSRFKRTVAILSGRHPNKPLTRLQSAARGSSTSEPSSVMAGRTTRMSVTFSCPFSLADLDGIQPAGTYRIQTVDVTRGNLSFLAYRRVSMTIELPAVGTTNSRRQVVTIDPVELEAALERDSAGNPAHTELQRL